MNRLLIAIPIVFLIFLSGCTHSLHMSHVSDFSPSFKEYSSGELIKSRAEHFTVMGFASDSRYVNDAYSKLMAQCHDGTIQGITTQFSTSHGFFSWTNYVEIQGLCIKSRATQSARF